MAEYKEAEGDERLLGQGSSGLVTKVTRKSDGQVGLWGNVGRVYIRFVYADLSSNPSHRFSHVRLSFSGITVFKKVRIGNGPSSLN